MERTVSSFGAANPRSGGYPAGSCEKPGRDHDDVGPDWELLKNRSQGCDNEQRAQKAAREGTRQNPAT